MRFHCPNGQVVLGNCARVGLIEREAPGKVMTARPLKTLSATTYLFTCPRFTFAEAPVKNVKTDTSWQPTFKRQLGVNMYIVRRFVYG